MWKIQNSVLKNITLMYPLVTRVNAVAYLYSVFALYINVLWYYILHGEGQIILFLVFIGLILFLQYFSVPLRLISVFNNCNNSSCGLSSV